MSDGPPPPPGRLYAIRCAGLCGQQLIGPDEAELVRMLAQHAEDDGCPHAAHGNVQSGMVLTDELPFADRVLGKRRRNLREARETLVAAPL